MKYSLLIATLLATSSFLVGCGSSDSSADSSSSSSQAASSSVPAVSSSESSNDSSSAAAAAVYAFKNTSDEDTVSYSGQIARHVIMDEIKKGIEGFESQNLEKLKNVQRLYSGEDQEFIDDFVITTSKSPDTIQKTIGAISSGKNLRGKIAGGYPGEDDKEGQRVGEPNRLINDEFFGWEGLSATDRPHEFVEYLFTKMEGLVTAPNQPSVAVDSGDGTIAKAYISAEGLDYQQLTQKFLLMAVGFSQGTNDYLAPGREFLDELNPDDEKNPPYSVGEHHFDEGFGYFAGARDSLSLTPVQISAAFNDSNDDGMIDLNSEYNYGQSVNCAKRETGDNNFTERAMMGFIDGRTTIAKLTAEQATLSDAEKEMYKTELASSIKVAALAWEECIAATVIHYINDVTSDMNEFVDDQFKDIDNFYNLAKHWAEMKGFALGLQFSPYSPFRDENESIATLAQLKEILAKMGTAPVLADGTQNGQPADITQYKADLMSIRGMLKEAYDFPQDDVEGW